MRLSRSTQAIRAFAIAALALLLLVFGTQCSSEVQVQSATDVSLVLGVGAQCAPRLKAVTVEVQRAGQVDFKETIPVTAASELPLARQFTQGYVEGVQYRAVATFEFTLDDAGGANVTSELPVEFPSGPTGRFTLSLPCASVGFSSASWCAYVP